MFDFSKNYFDLFGLPVAFLLDANALAERYREVQKVVHPDRYASASEGEQRLAFVASLVVGPIQELLHLHRYILITYLFANILTRA